MKLTKRIALALVPLSLLSLGLFPTASFAANIERSVTCSPNAGAVNVTMNVGDTLDISTTGCQSAGVGGPGGNWNFGPNEFFLRTGNYDFSEGTTVSFEATTPTSPNATGITFYPNNNLAGTRGPEIQITVNGDSTPPTLSSSTPADNATGVAVSANIVLNFSESVKAGTGDILLKKSSDDSTIATIPINDAQIAISGSTVTINPTADLDNSTGYYIEMASGVILDLSDNAFTGITSPSTLNFTTAHLPCSLINANNLGGNYTEGPIDVGGVTYTLVTFKKVGDCNWTVPAGVTAVDVLVVGGGGGGGGTGTRGNWSAGGGAGGFVTPKTGHGVTSGSAVLVTVGAGGLGGVGENPATEGNTVQIDAINAKVPQEGGKSIFDNVEADGGGRAAAAVINRTSAQTIIDTGPTKGGGGGGQADIVLDQGAFREGSTGLKGGAGHRDGPGSEGRQAAGGGAGAGGSGHNASAGISGNGGVGVSSGITGTSHLYGGGGGGGKNGSTNDLQGIIDSAGSGGSGGGGAGGKNAVGGNGADNTGGGGGGAGRWDPANNPPRSGGNGGSGVVIVRYSALDTTPPANNNSSGNPSPPSAAPAVSPPVAPATVSPPVAPATVTPRGVRRLSPPSTAPVTPAPALGSQYDLDAGPRALVGGQLTPLATTRSPNGGITLATPRLQFEMRPTGTSQTSSSPAPSLPTDVTLSRGQSAMVSGGGFAPRSSVRLSLDGVAGQGLRELAEISVNGEGKFDTDLQFDARGTESPVPIGRHGLQVVGVDSEGNETLLNLTIAISQGDPQPEPNRTRGALPALSLGQSLATSAGIPETVRIEAISEAREVSVISGTWRFRVNLDAAGGSVEQSDQGATMILAPSQTTTVSGEGFQPDTRVDVWLFSEPSLLGSVTVSGDGTFSGEFAINPGFVAPGAHTLQLQGVGTDGFIKAANLGVLVQDSQALESTNPRGLMVWAIIALVTVAVIILVALMIRNRRNK